MDMRKRMKKLTMIIVKIILSDKQDSVEDELWDSIRALSLP